MAHERITYDELMRAGHNKYAVTIAVAKRARQIHDGAPVLVPTDASKSVSAALAEIMEGRVVYGLGVVEKTPKSSKDGASTATEEPGKDQESVDTPETENAESEEEAGE